jgi:uncharacterized protein involved in outer membrane biogenesis
MEDRTPARSRRWRVVAFWVLGIVAAYGVIVGLVVPPIAKKLIAEKAGERLGRVVVLEDLKVNPFTLDATARGFRILEADRTTPFASFDTLDIEGSATSLYRFAPVADSVTLTGLKVNLVRDGETHYNLSDIVSRLAAAPAQPPAKKDEEPAKFSISNVRLVNARIDFDDRPMGKKHQVADINIAVPFISNLPSHLKEFVQPSFAASVNGSPLKVTGETLPFENSLRTNIALDLDAVDLRRYVEYSPMPLPVKVESGKLHATLTVRFTQSARKDATIDIAGKLALSDLGIVNTDGSPLTKAGAIEADIASFDPIAGLVRVTSLHIKDVHGLGGDALLPASEAKNIQVDLKKKFAQVETIASSGGVVNLTRNREGGIDLPSIALPPSSPPPWTFSIAKLGLEGFKLSVTDQSVKPAATHRVQVASLEVTEVTNANGLKGALAAKLGLDKGGSVDLAATFALDPPLVNAKVDARRVDLVPLRPYVGQFPTVALKSGAASAKGTIVLRGKGDAMHVSYNGGAEISNLATTETVDREELLNWKSVRTSGVDFAWAANAPLTLAVAEIVVDKVYSRLILNADGKFNVQRLRTGSPAEPAVAAPAAEPPPRNVRIDRITFVDSRLNFTDLFIKPNYSADVGELQGSVTNLSSDPQSRAVVDLKGRYDQASPVVIAGTVNPLRGDLFVDIAAKGQGIELPKLTAYSQRYAGYGITEGKLTLDVKYHIDNGKLEGRNKILIERLTFGDKVESPEATKLPVLFAVNLLKDANGEIQLELPITGSLSDPQFEIGALITQVLGNLLKKAVTSPFSLLSATFGGGGGNGSGGAGKDGAGKGGAGGGEDLAFVEFDPGASDIAPADRKKLDTITKALQGRPGLTLTMASRLDPEKDLQALREAAFQRKLLAAKGGNATAIDDAEYPKIVRAVYAAEKFPKPAPVNGVVREPSVAEMEAQLLEKIPVGEEELHALAAKRADQVRSYLVGKGQLPENRVLVAASVAEAQPVKARASRVDFSLQ